MSGGGSGGGATQQNVTQTNIPAYARPYFTRMMGRGEAASNRKYEEYPGQRTATFTPDQESAFAGARNLQDTYLPAFNNAAQTYQNSLNQANKAVSDYNPNNVGKFTDADRSAYMNPYITDVIGRAQAGAQRNFAESQAQRDASAKNASAFGGSRSAIADEMARRSYDTQLADTTAGLLNTGYGNAQQQFNADRQAQEAARQYAARLGMEGAQFGLQSGQAMAGLGSEAYKLGSAQSELLNRYGGQQRDLQQKQYDVDYGNFINARDQERNNLAFLSSLLRGVPVNPQSNTITYQQGGSDLSSLAGLGIAGLGAYRASSGT
jgi:hypothetical protein